MNAPLQPGLLDWSAATVIWTDDGHQLSVPLSENVSDRAASLAQAALADQLEKMVAAPTLSWVSAADSGEVPNPNTGSDGSPANAYTGELGICSPTLISLHPLSLRHAAESAVGYGYQVAANAEVQERPYIANWLSALTER
ncbi:MAG: hypothetical protein JWM76_3615 [Pseudonocardiales bacterium]|nr:hypothetical protein [Pseudonocardiales bacterium]